MKPFSLMQWNVLYTEPIDRIAAEIKRLNPDIVCLQELTRGYQTDRSDTAEYLTQQLSYQGVSQYAPMRFPDGTHGQMGCAVLTRFPVTSWRVELLQSAVVEAGKVQQDGRVYVALTITIGGHPVTVATTHLPFNPSFRTTPAKRQMVEQIIGWAETSPRYIIAADFNSTPRSQAMVTLRRQFRHAGPALSQPTWTKRPFNIGPHSFDGLKWRLDHVLYRGDLKAKAAQVVDTVLSDHAPILVTFAI